jgi:hypothetical protein
MKVLIPEHFYFYIIFAAFSFGCYGRLPHSENNNITLDFLSDDIGFLSVVIYHNNKLLINKETKTTVTMV